MSKPRGDTPAPDLLIVAANARSLIANRGDLVRQILAAGLTVEAAVPEVDFLEDAYQLGIPLHKIRLRRTGMNPLVDAGSLVGLYRLMRQRRPRAVLAYGVKPIVYGLLAARLAGVRCCYAMVTGLGHAYTTKNRRTRLARGVLSILYRLGLGVSRRTFFQNPDDLRTFTELGLVSPLRAVLINGSGVNLDRFPLRPMPSTDAPRYLFIGRLLHEKGIREFVDACNLLRSQVPAAEFLVVGGVDESLPHSIPSSEVDAWQKEGVVKFVGTIKDVRAWLEWCSVLVLPSYREGTPRSVLEAMATGRAVITSDAPGCRETVEDGVNGYLVAPRDAEALAAAMLRLANNPDAVARFGLAGRRMAEEKYDVRKVNATILRAMEFQ